MTAIDYIPNDRIWVIVQSVAQQGIYTPLCFIDICAGNRYDADLFAQIMYWHKPTKRGESRLTIERDGYLWLAKRYEDWWEECRIDATTARKSIERLVKRGLIFKKIYHFEGKPTVHLRINAEGFEKAVLRLSDTAGQIDYSMCPHITDGSDTTGQIDPSMCPNVADGNDTAGQMEMIPRSSSYNESYAETTAETTTESKTKKKDSARKRAEASASSATFDAEPNTGQTPDISGQGGDILGQTPDMLDQGGKALPPKEKTGDGLSDRPTHLARPYRTAAEASWNTYPMPAPFAHLFCNQHLLLALYPLLKAEAQKRAAEIATNKAIGAIIKAWLDASGVIKLSPYENKTYRGYAQALFQAGFTPTDVTEFIEDRLTEEFWQDKGIELATVAKDIARWKATQEDDENDEEEDGIDPFDDGGERIPMPEEIRLRHEERMRKMIVYAP